MSLYFSEFLAETLTTQDRLRSKNELTFVNMDTLCMPGGDPGRNEKLLGGLEYRLNHHLNRERGKGPHRESKGFLGNMSEPSGE